MSTLTAIQKTLEAQNKAKAIKVEPNSADTSLVDSREVGVLISGSNATVKNSLEAGGVTIEGGSPNRASIDGGDITIQGGHQPITTSAHQGGDVIISSGDGYYAGAVYVLGGSNLTEPPFSSFGGIYLETGVLKEDAGGGGSSTTSTGLISIQTGAVSASTADSGVIAIKSGSPHNHTDSTSGNILLESGSTGSLAHAGHSGNITIKTGQGGTDESGIINLITGDTGSATSGTVNISTGASSSSQSGGVNISSGDSHLAGDVKIAGGANIDSSADSTTGTVTIQTGGLSALSTKNTGAILVQTGDTEGTQIGSGPLTLKSGNVKNSVQPGVVYSGDVILKSGDGDPDGTGTGWESSGAVNVETGFSSSRESGVLTLKSGNVDSASPSGDVIIESGSVAGTSYAQTGDVFIKSGETPWSNSGSITIKAGDNTGSQASGGGVGTVLIKGGDRPNGASNSRRAGNVFIQGGQAVFGESLDNGHGNASYGGNVEIKAFGYGSIQSDSYTMWLRTHGSGFTVDSDAWISIKTKNNVTTDDSVRYLNILTGSHNGDNQNTGDITIRTGQSEGRSTGSSTKTSGDITIKTGNSPADAEDTSTARSGNITLETGTATGTEVGSGTVVRGEVKVKSNSIASGGNDRKLVQIASDGILKTLGINILGYGSLELRNLIKDSFVCRVPIHFSNVTVNQPSSDPATATQFGVDPANIGGNGNHFPLMVETYTGEPIIQNNLYQYTNTDLRVKIFPRAGEGFRTIGSTTENMVSIQEQFYFVPSKSGSVVGPFLQAAALHGKLKTSTQQPNTLNNSPQYQFFFDYVVYITD